MHRADFVDLLAAALPDGVVNCGHRGVGFEQGDDTASVTFDNGVTIEADIVVAADGIHSSLRPNVFPPSTPVFHGTISYRGLVHRDRIPDWPMDRRAIRTPCGRSSRAGTRGSRTCWRRSTTRSAGRSTTASRCRPGPSGA